MKYILHPLVRAHAHRGLGWTKSFFSQFDTTRVGWLRIDLGREYRDRRGRIYRKYRGVYGRCWYPSESQPTVRMSCQVPGPFPCSIETRKRPVYRNADGTWPVAARSLRSRIQTDRRTGRQWKRVCGETRVRNLDEAIVWIVAHEAYHWLRITRQIPGRNNEIEADAFADARLTEFRQGLESVVRSHTPAGLRTQQGELFDVFA